jgi:5-methylthioadenosine/S-adenosylhomocysteine deaminase
MSTSFHQNAGLIRGRHIVEAIGADGAPIVHVDAAIYHLDGRIEAIGPFKRLSQDHPNLPVVGDAEAVVVPGFINAHHHVGLTPFQLGSPDFPLELWFASRLGARAVDLYLDTLYSAFEMIASGVTTVQHLHGRLFGSLDHLLTGARQIISAYRDVGMRVSYSYMMRDQNRLVYEDDDAFCDRLPLELGARLRALLRAQVVPITDTLSLFTALAKENPAGGRTRVQLAPSNLHWLSDKALADIAAASKFSGAPLHMHLLETAFQREYARRRTGGSAVRHLHKLGLLGPNMTLGHSVWSTGDEIDLLAGTGTCICCNPSSNLRLRSGIAPHAAFRRAGLTIGLGIDEAGLNEDRDMLLEMRMLLLLSRVPGFGDGPFTAPEILRIATEHGAATTPFKGTIGVLRPGYAADCLLFDWNQIASPFLDPRVTLVDALVQRARSRDICSVVIDGATVYHRGAFTLVDKAAVLKELSDRMSSPPSASDLQRASLSLDVLPHVRSFYDGYADVSPNRGYAPSATKI